MFLRIKYWTLAGVSCKNLLMVQSWNVLLGIRYPDFLAINISRMKKFLEKKRTSSSTTTSTIALFWTPFSHMRWKILKKRIKIVFYKDAETFNANKRIQMYFLCCIVRLICFCVYLCKHKRTFRFVFVQTIYVSLFYLFAYFHLKILDAVVCFWFVSTLTKSEICSQEKRSPIQREKKPTMFK